MLKNCLHCAAEFDAARESAKFCGDACRQAYNRSHGDAETVPTVEETPTIEKNISVKHGTRWDKVCTDAEWKRYPSMCDTKAKHAALTELYDSFSAEELVEHNIRPPKWKKQFKTYAEAKESLLNGMKEMDLDLNTQGYWATPVKGVENGVIDYSTWK